MKRKYFFMAVIITVASQIVSGKSLYPQEFKVFFSDRIATENAQSLRYEDDVLVLDEKISVKAQKMRINEKNILDLRAVDPEKKFSKAAISAVIYSEKNRVLRMGMGADWWFDCYCNGKYIFGTTQAGNLFWPPSVSSFVFEIPLRVGRNELTIFTRSGEGGWTVAVGEPPANADLNQTRQEPLKAKVLYGPYLTNPAPTSITVSYVVQGRQSLELEYRKKGNKVWKKLQLLRGGQLIEDERVMRFDLTGLHPDTVYEYRVLKRIGSELRDAQPDKVRTFKTFSNKPQDFSFWIMADTQTHKLHKLAQLKNLLQKRSELKNADMFVHLGDISSNMDDIELALFDSFFKAIPSNQPIVAVRGNHEFDGEQAGRYLKYLGSRDHKSYQAFKLGNIFFIVLDTGHHLPKDSTNSFQKYTGLNELDTLFSEQTLWLQEVVQTPDFRNADCRIVFAHVAPHGQVDTFKHMIPRLQKMTAPLFKGSPAKYPVDLWFAGHTHVYKVVQADKNWQFPVLIPGGGGRKSGDAAAVLVKIKNNTVYLETIHSNGKTNDRFVLNTKVIPAVLKPVKTLP